MSFLNIFSEKVINNIYTIEGMQNYINSSQCHKLQLNECNFEPYKSRALNEIIQYFQQDFATEVFQIYITETFNNYIIYKNDSGIHLLNFNTLNILECYQWYIVLEKYNN